LAMLAQEPSSLAPRQRLERLLPMAGFQVSMYGRFWVSTEAIGRAVALLPSRRLSLGWVPRSDHELDRVFGHNGQTFNDHIGRSIVASLGVRDRQAHGASPK
jgi:hypothetical protein